MPKGIGSIQVKRQRGKPTVIVYGQTPRGQRYPKAFIELHTPEKDIKNFKIEMAAAVEKLLA